MNMERNTIEKNATIVFDTTATANDFYGLPEDFEGNIIIHGDIDICDEVYIPGNLYVIGNISCEVLRIHGDFHLMGAILDATNIHVYGDCSINSYMHIDTFEVEGDLLFEGEDMYGENVFVAGDFSFKCAEIHTENVCVAGDCTGTSKTFFRTARVLGKLHYKRTQKSIFLLSCPVQEIKARNVEILEIDC